MMVVLESDGGHGGFDQTAEETGFDYLVQEQKKKLESKGYTGDIQQEALFLSLPIYKKRHEMNETFWNSELQRETETTTSYEIRYNEEREQYEMYHPGYETYLQDMLARTQRYAKEKNQPQVFNKEESDSIIQAERALISGQATSILYPVWHESGKVRYVTEMTVDGNCIKNRYVDIGKIAGRDLSREEAIQMLRSLSNQHEGEIEKKDDQEQSTILTLKDGEIGFNEISSVASKKFDGDKEERNSKLWVHPDRPFEEERHIRPMYVVKNADQKGKIYFWDGIVGNHGLLGTLQIAERMYKEKFSPFIQRRLQKDKDQHPPIILKKEHPQPEKEQQSDKASSVISRIEIQKNRVDNGRTDVFFAEKTGIGIGGAIYILDTLTVPSAKLTKKERRVLKKFVKEKQQKESKKKRIQKETRSGKEGKIRRYRDISLQRNKEIKKQKGKESKRRPLKKRAYAEIFGKIKERNIKRSKEVQRVVFSFKEAIKGKKRNEFKIPLKELHLLRVFEKLTRKTHRTECRKQDNPDKKINCKTVEKYSFKEQKNRLNRSIGEFIRALILFEFIRQIGKHTNAAEQKNNQVVRSVNRTEKKVLDSPDSERTPWVLLSIIWHMSAIREQGQSVFLPKKKRKKITKKKKSKMVYTKNAHTFSTQGLIYAYNQ